MLCSIHKFCTAVVLVICTRDYLPAELKIIYHAKYASNYCSIQFSFTQLINFRFRKFFDECNDGDRKGWNKKLCVLSIFEYVFCWWTWRFCWTVGPMFKQNQRFKCKDGLWLNLEPVQSKLCPHNGCYLHYTYTTLQNIWSKIHPPKSVPV